MVETVIASVSSRDLFLNTWIDVASLGNLNPDSGSVKIVTVTLGHIY